MNTSDSVKKVTPIAEMSEEEAAALPRAGDTRGRPETGNVQTVGNTYDVMEDLNEETLAVDQVLVAPPGLHAVYQYQTKARLLKAVKVDYLVSSEGTLWGFIGSRDEIDITATAETLPGFEGYVVREGASELSSAELEKLLELTTKEKE